jgi:hypothetical protein
MEGSIMQAWLFESSGHRPLLRFEDGTTGIPINLHLVTRYDFLSVLGRRFEIGMQLSQQHFTVRLPKAANTAQT